MVIFTIGERPRIIRGESLLVIVLPQSDSYTLQELNSLLRDVPAQVTNKVSYLTFSPPTGYPNEAGRFTVIVNEEPHDYIEMKSPQWEVYQKLLAADQFTAEIFEDEVVVLKKAHDYLNHLIQEYKSKPTAYDQLARR